MTQQGHQGLTPRRILTLTHQNRGRRLLPTLRLCDDADDAEAGSYRYLGCFKDVDGVDRDLKGRDLVLTGLTTGTCAGQCQPVGFAYFGLQFGRRCLCGDDYGSHGPSVGQTPRRLPTTFLSLSFYCAAALRCRMDWV